MARSRLYQSRFLQPNTHFAAFFEIYKIHKPLHRSKFNFCRIFAILFWKNSVNSREFWKSFLKSAEISSFSLRISRKIVGIPGNPRKLTEIRKLLRNFAKLCENPIRFCQFRHEILVVDQLQSFVVDQLPKTELVLVRILLQIL